MTFEPNAAYRGALDRIVARRSEEAICQAAKITVQAFIDAGASRADLLAVAEVFVREVNLSIERVIPTSKRRALH